MNTEQQNKLWFELSEESKKYIKSHYADVKDPNRELYDYEDRAQKIIIEDIFGCHNLNPQPLTYDDVSWELFKDGAYQYRSILNDYSDKTEYNVHVNETYPLNLTSQKQAEKLLAINKLLNVAKYLNGDWKPDFDNKDDENKIWSLGIDEYDNKNKIRAYYIDLYGAKSEIVYFRTEELAKRVIEILGEDTIKLAISTEY